MLESIADDAHDPGRECPQTFAAGATYLPNMLAGLGARGKTVALVLALFECLGKLLRQKPLQMMIMMLAQLWGQYMTAASDAHDAGPAWVFV